MALGDDPGDAVEAALGVIALREPVVRAWAFLDPALPSVGNGPLRGVTVGVKDVIDTADMPTEYGSAVYAGHRPLADAASVAMLRSAGAVVLGKTVTAELAWFTPGPTTNPWRPTHTPGGSSSGSAAAVACGMVDVALGTQTGGSVIRPASFCGVFGLKPTFGSVPTSGVKPAAPSLDTVGLFARDVDTLSAVASVLVAGFVDDRSPVKFAFVPTDDWDRADADCLAVVSAAASAVGTGPPVALPPSFVGLAELQPVVQAYEGARALAWERSFRRSLLSEGLNGILDWGAAIDHLEYLAVLERVSAARASAAALFGDADVLVTPAVVGEAPLGLSSTGDPRFCRLWTLLGYPTISVPGSVGSTGLPIGVQLVARPWQEGRLLAAARVLHDHLLPGGGGVPS
jgi:Asp-tRNA(Asn)/Glu-tRNA(Gln) amidotransferase A subunit family amidase